MERSTLPVGVKTLKNWREKGTLSFGNPVQRAGSQWNLLQKSLLIHSVLANYPIPAVYLLKEKGENDVTLYDCLDSKQRLTSIFGFIDGEYALHASTPEVVVDGTTYDLANLRFEDLSEECRDIITGYRFSIQCIEGATEQEVEEIFRRLNNSTPLSGIQKCRTVMGTELARWCKEVCEMDFFQHCINLTVAQARSESDLAVLLQGMLLISSRNGTYTNWKGISVADVTKYCEFIRGKFGDKERWEIMSVADFLADAFNNEKHKFLKKSNVPLIMVLGAIAVENDCEPEEFKLFIDAFSNCICDEFERNMGSGNVKRVKTEGRLKAIAKRFVEYFELEGVDVLGDGELYPQEGVSSESGVSESEAVEVGSSEEIGEAAEDGGENADTDGVSVSPDEGFMNEPENPSENEEGVEELSEDEEEVNSCSEKIMEESGETVNEQENTDLSDED